MMERTINESLKISTSIPLTHVNRFQIQWGINDHASLHLEGELPYEESIACQNNCFAGSSFIIRYRSNQQDHVLFYGLIKKIDFLWDGGVSQIRLEAISASWKLDQRRVNSSFQDKEMTYAALAQHVADRAGAEVITLCGGDTTLSGALIQCMETDWEFLKRIASHLNKFLVCDIVTGRPAFWFGMRKGNQVTIATTHSDQIRFDPLLKRTSYIIHSREAYDLGDRTTWMGKSVIVSQRIVEFQNKGLLFTYCLEEEFHLKQEIQYNEQIIGRGFMGTVKQISNEMLKIQLDMDGNNASAQFWYPWRPETGNIMYAMPEIGSPVLLTIPGHDEREAEVRVCLHRDGAANNRKKEYQNRCLNIVDDAVLRLYPDKLELSKKGDKHLLTLDDEDGIRLETSKDFKMEAKGNIFSRGNVVAVNASEEINGVVG